MSMKTSKNKDSTLKTNDDYIETDLERPQKIYIKEEK
jgi:hypothetical protein